MSSVNITQVRIDQIDQLLQISKDTFIESYEHLNDPVDFQLYLEKAFNIQQLTNELLDTQSSFYFLFWKGELAAYIKLVDGVGKDSLLGENNIYLERIYVQSDFQGKGLGSHLINFVADKSRQQKREGVWLTVWEENPNAISWYYHKGFKRIGEHIFVIGNDPQKDHVMYLSV
ncbi:MAG: GNAT family N-acetyltransferase [Bacteroidota bacterium]